MKILITAATTARAHHLRNRLSGEEVLLGDHLPLPAFMAKSMIILPHPAADSYTHQMLKLCLDHHIDTVYPLADDEMDTLSLSEQLFTEYNIRIADGRD